MLLSICIPTYNRARIVALCLDAISRLEDAPGARAEVVLVDNNSRDGTREAVEPILAAMPFPARYVFEPRQGLSAARNRAVAESEGDYVGFLDDECVVPPGWLAAAALAVAESRPAFVGGPYLGAFLPGVEIPAWYRQEYGDAYFASRLFPRGPNPEFRASGGNFFVRRDVFAEHAFDERLGVVGNVLRLGEESALQDAWLAAHPDDAPFYEPDMVVRHFVMPDKMTLAYHARRAMEGGASYGGRPTGREMARLAIEVAAAPARILGRDRAAFPSWRNYVFERTIPSVMPTIGKVAETVRSRYPGPIR